MQLSNVSDLLPTSKINHIFLPLNVVLNEVPYNMVNCMHT